MNPFLPSGQRIPFQLPTSQGVPFYISNEHVLEIKGCILSPTDRFRKSYQYSTPGPGTYGKLPLLPKRHSQTQFETHSKLQIRNISPEFINVSQQFKYINSHTKQLLLNQSDRFSSSPNLSSSKVQRRKFSKFCE